MWLSTPVSNMTPAAGTVTTSRPSTRATPTGPPLSRSTPDGGQHHGAGGAQTASNRDGTRGAGPHRQESDHDERQDCLGPAHGRERPDGADRGRRVLRLTDERCCEQGRQNEHAHEDRDAAPAAGQVCTDRRRSANDQPGDEVRPVRIETQPVEDAASEMCRTQRERRGKNEQSAQHRNGCLHKMASRDTGQRSRAIQAASARLAGENDAYRRRRRSATHLAGSGLDSLDDHLACLRRLLVSWRPRVARLHRRSVHFVIVCGHSSPLASDSSHESTWPAASAPAAPTPPTGRIGKDITIPFGRRSRYTPGRPIELARSKWTCPWGRRGGLSSTAEHRNVDPKVMGSKPIGHPKPYSCRSPQRSCGLPARMRRWYPADASVEGAAVPDRGGRVDAEASSGPAGLPG